jgi:hypothetical protein
MAARKTPSQWARIEREYLAGEDSIREIADRNEISEAAIRKRAKAEGWERPVRSREPVRTLLPVPRSPAAQPVEPPAPRSNVEIADHARQLVGRMLDELDTVTAYQGELEEIIEDATAEDDNEQRRDAMMKAISLPARSQIAKNLAGALKTINEAAGPQQGKKAATQERATAIGRKFGSIGAPTAKSIN